MGTKTTTSRKAQHSAEYGNAVVYSDAQMSLATGDIALNSVIQPVLIPGGTAVDKVRIKVSDMDSGANLAAKIGVTPADGSAAPSGADTAFSAAAAFAQTAGVINLDVIPPYVVEKDSYLNIVITTAAGTAVAGTVAAVVHGEALGKK